MAALGIRLAAERQVRTQETAAPPWRLVAVAAVAGTGLAAAGALAYYWHRRRQRPAPRVSRLISTSLRLYRLHRLQGALEASQMALAVASEEIPGTPEHLAALHHLTTVLGASRRFEEALATVDELLQLTASVHGADSAMLIPALHARAELLEAAGEPLAKAAEQVAHAREIRRAVSGPNAMESAFASINLAKLLMRGSKEADLPQSSRSTLIEKSIKLGLEACSIASVAGNLRRAAEFASSLLDLLGNDESKTATQARQKLRDAYLEAAGEEYGAMVR